MINEAANRIAKKLKGYVDDKFLDLSASVGKLFAQQDAFGAKLESLSVPKDGKDAEVDYDKVAALVADEVGKIPVPKDGADADEGRIEQQLILGLTKYLNEKFEALPTPRDGKDADVTLIAQLVVDEVARAVAVIPVPERGPKGDAGRDGDPGPAGDVGRDAIDLRIVTDFDDSRVYPKGTVASWRGGLIKAERKTEPLLDDDYAKAGWAVIMNGVFGESEESRDDGRFILRTTTYTDGRKFERETVTAAMIYRGIWAETEKYLKGDVVTSNNQSWCCQGEASTDRPGTSKAWRLIARRGADASVSTQRSSTPVRLGDGGKR
jgi:hypothetical protein